MSNFTQKLSSCCVCKGKIWTDENKYYEMLGPAEKTRRFLKLFPFRQKYLVSHVMKVMFSWKEKGFFSKEIIDIEILHICDKCFLVAAHKNKIIKKGYSHHKWVLSPYVPLVSVDSLLGILIKQQFGNMGGRSSEPLNKIRAMLRDIKDNENKYRKFVQIAVSKEINKINQTKDKKAQAKEQKTKEREERKAKRAEEKKEERKRISELKASIKKLLAEKAVKMPASEIDAHLKNKNVDEIKKLCEEMYRKGQISRTGNYRYFILTEEKKKPKKATPKKSEAVDVKSELKKYKEMMDDGLITQEDYDAKKKELLGL